ncbi:MAG: POT family proton-dependent oligopeptide transporter, partial [Francisellaceae bacterium]
AISTLFFTTVLYYLFAGWILLVCVIVSLLFLIRLFIKISPAEKKGLFSICIFMIFGLIFWVFDQQGGSSISLFIERNINRDFFGWMIPAASFQSINPFAILIGGAIVTLLWKMLARMGLSPRALVKITFGMILISIGFFLIAQGARIAYITDGHASMIWVVSGLLIMGVAELFVDPVALAEITRLNPAGQVGFLAGVYMLLTGAIANYVAAEVAQMTSVNTVNTASNFLIESAKNYYSVFSKISSFTIWTCVTLIMICFLTAMYARLKRN